MKSLRLKLAALVAIVGAVLGSPATAFDVGSVWGAAATAQSITVNCKITKDKFKLSDPPQYQVCWRPKSDWWKVVCNDNTQSTSAMPFAISGLTPDTEYKIRINVSCYKKNVWGNWGNLEWRNINEVFLKTAPAPMAPIAGGTIVAVPTDTSLTVTVTWTGGLGTQAPEWIRIGYKKNSNFFYDLDGVLRDDDAPMPSWWTPGNWVKGAKQIDKADILATNTVTFTGLKQCRKYIVEAAFWDGIHVSMPPNGLDGVTIGSTKVETTGHCGFGSFKTEPLFDAENSIGAGYLSAAGAFYASGFVPATRVTNAFAVGDFAIAVDHAPGGSTVELHTLALGLPASIAARASTAVPTSLGFQNAEVAGLAGGNQMMVMGDEWEVYGFANPVQPHHVGGLDGPDVGNDVATSGSVAYVSMGQAGVAVVDVSNPATPTLVNIVAGFGDAQGVHVNGNRLYVAAPDLGAISFDISNPLSPTLIGLYVPGYVDSASAIAADSANVYVLNDAGLEVLETVGMTRIGVHGGLSNATKVEVGGNACYVLGDLISGPQQFSGILRFDVTTPSAPAFLGNYTPEPGPGGCVLRTFSLQGNRILAALDASGMAVIDVAQMVPSGQHELGRWRPGSSPILAHLSASDATLAAAVAMSESAGETSINDEDLLTWLLLDNPTSFDAWQAEGSLQTAGLDVETWTQNHFPIEWAKFAADLGPAGHEGFNIDLGDSAGTPQADCYGPAMRAGVWHTVGAPWSSTLVDVNGRATSVVASSSAASAHAFDEPETIDEDQALYDDGQRIGGPGSTVDWTFANLLPGTYLVTTVAWNPEGTGSAVSIDVLGSVQGPLTCTGGAWPGIDVEGETFVRHAVDVTGSTLTIHAVTLSGTGVLNGFQLERIIGSTPQVYCTAKVNSLGCTPGVTFAGTPSASSGFGFQIDAVNVINNKNGLLFYGTTMGNGVPFQGGFLCVKVPIKRTSVQNSGGNPPPNDCSGTFAFDFNAYVATGQDPALVADQTVWAQYWSRDPQDPFTASLTNAVTFTLGM